MILDDFELEPLYKASLQIVFHHLFQLDFFTIRFMKSTWKMICYKVGNFVFIGVPQLFLLKLSITTKIDLQTFYFLFHIQSCLVNLNSKNLQWVWLQLPCFLIFLRRFRGEFTTKSVK